MEKYTREYPNVELRIEADPDPGGFLALFVEDRKNNLFVGAKITPDAAIRLHKCLEEEIENYLKS